MKSWFYAFFDNIGVLYKQEKQSLLDNSDLIKDNILFLKNRISYEKTISVSLYYDLVTLIVLLNDLATHAFNQDLINNSKSMTFLTNNLMYVRDVNRFAKTLSDLYFCLTVYDKHLNESFCQLIAESPEEKFVSVSDTINTNSQFKKTDSKCIDVLSTCSDEFDQHFSYLQKHVDSMNNDSVELPIGINICSLSYFRYTKGRKISNNFNYCCDTDISFLKNYAIEFGNEQRVEITNVKEKALLKSRLSLINTEFDRLKINVIEKEPVAAVPCDRFSLMKKNFDYISIVDIDDIYSMYGSRNMYSIVGEQDSSNDYFLFLPGYIFSELNKQYFKMLAEVATSINLILLQDSRSVIL